MPSNEVEHIVLVATEDIQEAHHLEEPVPLFPNKELAVLHAYAVAASQHKWQYGSCDEEAQRRIRECLAGDFVAVGVTEITVAPVARAVRPVKPPDETPEQEEARMEALSCLKWDEHQADEVRREGFDPYYGEPEPAAICDWGIVRQPSPRKRVPGPCGATPVVTIRLRTPAHPEVRTAVNLCPRHLLEWAAELIDMARESLPTR
jgi:hypothetical protein